MRHTFITKIWPVKETQIFNKNPRTPDKTEKKTDLVKKTSSGNTGRDPYFGNHCIKFYPCSSTHTLREHELAAKSIRQ